MKQKILYLTLGCIFSVIALACIQGYFIYNTYLLRAKEANSAITQKFLKLETDGKLDSINNSWMRKTFSFFEKYKRGEVSKDGYLKLIQQTGDSLSPVMNHYIEKQNFFEGYDVSYSNYVISATIVAPGQKTGDTLFAGKALLFGNNTDGTPETQASQSNWRGNNRDFVNCLPSGDKNYDFEVVTSRYYSIANWERQVLYKLSGLLIFSVVLLGFVVLLFYLTIKNLIRQRKIADVKTDFINNITHEFQTPLAALDIAVKTLQRKDGGLSAEQNNNTLQIIDRQNKRMQKLFSQVTQASLTPEADKLHELGYEDVVEIINDFRLSHPEAVIHFRQETEGTILRMDKFHLNTILVNLLDNAVKYGATQVDITLSGNNTATHLTVKDNGPGIPAKEQRLLFDKFYRVQKGDIHTTKGLGLGLYYVKRIADAYGGHAAVKSEEGNGAEFTLLLPV